MFTASENDPIWRNLQLVFFFSHHLYDHLKMTYPPNDPRLCGCGCVFVPTLQKRCFLKVRFMYSSMEPRVMACVLIVVTSWSHLREEHITTWWGNSGVLLTEGPFPRHPGIPCEDRCEWTPKHLLKFGLQGAQIPPAKVFGEFCKTRNYLDLFNPKNPDPSYGNTRPS